MSEWTDEYVQGLRDHVADAEAALADRDATIARLTAELQEIANGG